ncbi:hypothetical protein [Fictibacillus terranigra]|uniref:Chloride channel protein n=1 Tax=Fictibacillus terranigra TaxID=3058424 RepID=A0ABT8E2Z9_9BACL|nr:hypothetical protein [Fictibacillus sp. CENA-BCM004]MDN4072276.1 hypothetical protein [Fictibacillus sp. CENA-BCM004]
MPSIGGVKRNRGNSAVPLGQRWIPFLAGKCVPTALAVVPAAVVSVMLTTTGTRIVLDFFVSGDYTNWGASTPLLLFPIWGIAIGSAMILYYYRRTGFAINADNRWKDSKSVGYRLGCCLYSSFSFRHNNVLNCFL